MVKNPPANAGDAREVGSILGQEDPLEKEAATYTNILGLNVASLKRSLVSRVGNEMREDGKSLTCFQ